eukprot:2357685-Amphidinium_carterae.1
MERFSCELTFFIVNIGVVERMIFFAWPQLVCLRSTTTATWRGNLPSFFNAFKSLSKAHNTANAICSTEKIKFSEETNTDVLRWYFETFSKNMRNFNDFIHEILSGQELESADGEDFKKTKMLKKVTVHPIKLERVLDT